MKKQKYQFIILAVICLLCVGGYFVIRSHEFEPEEETAETAVTDFEPEDVTELTVTGDHELSFMRKQTVPGRKPWCRRRRVWNNMVWASLSVP